MQAEEEVGATADTDEADEWHFGEWSVEDSGLGSGGLLRTTLDELVALRESVAADRVGLADALSASFEKIDAQLLALREEMAGIRAAAEAQAAIDVAALVKEAVAEEEERLIEAIAAALNPPLTALREEIPTEQMERISTDIRHLRKLLIGPN